MIQKPLDPDHEQGGKVTHHPFLSLLILSIFHYIKDDTLYLIICCALWNQRTHLEFKFSLNQFNYVWSTPGLVNIDGLISVASANQTYPFQLLGWWFPWHYLRFFNFIRFFSPFFHKKVNSKFFKFFSHSNFSVSKRTKCYRLWGLRTNEVQQQQFIFRSFVLSF